MNEVKTEHENVKQPLKQFFLFISNGNTYAIEAIDVVEIVELSLVTQVPMMRNYVKGVTNIRGNIVTVIDLMQRFGLSESKISKKTSLVILRSTKQKHSLQIACIIDEIYEVEYIEELEDTPDFGTEVDKKYIQNMIMFNDEHIPVLNLKSILKLEEISELSSGENKDHG